MPRSRKQGTERKFKINEKYCVHEKASAPSSGCQTIAFVNVDNPQQVKDKVTQRQIRRHVMKEIGQSRRKYNTDLIERREDVASISVVLSQVPRALPALTPTHWGEVRICPNFRRLFLAMNEVSGRLASMSLGDSSAPWAKKKLRGEFQDGQLQHEDEQSATTARSDLVQYTDSLGQVRKSIHAAESPGTRRTIMGTIICLAYFDLRRGNFKEWAMHMQGLEYVVYLHGGVQALEPHQALRQSLFLTDVLGALIFDAYPKFPQPASAPNPRSWTQRQAKSRFKSLKDIESQTHLSDRSSIVIRSAIDYTSQLADLLNHLSQQSAQQMALDLLIPVVRIAHNLLSLPGSSYYGFKAGNGYTCLPHPPLSAAAQLVRASALALVSTVITTISNNDMYCATHRRGYERNLLIYSKHEGWGEWEHLKPWVLVIQITVESGPTRDMYLDEIMDAMQLLSLRSWDDLIAHLYSIAWIKYEGIPEMIKLKSDIETRLAQTPKICQSTEIQQEIGDLR